MRSKNIVNFSTTLSKETKDLLERFCKVRDHRINHIVEKAIMELIEDEIDRAIIEERELEDLVEWKKHG